MERKPELRENFKPKIKAINFMYHSKTGAIYKETFSPGVDFILAPEQFFLKRHLRLHGETFIQG